MALSEEEKKIAKAYNIGYLMSTYEPRLLADIIRRNPTNEFVKSMQIGRDHQEFSANIPRKDYSPAFKNGFYNGRTLAEHNPQLINKIMNSKGINKDYKKGLESARKEYAIKGIQQKINQEPKAPVKEQAKDKDYQKGFNIGYRLSENYASVIGHAQRLNDKYATFLQGMQSGIKQYDHDLSLAKEKDGVERLFPDDLTANKFEDAVVRDAAIRLSDISNSQMRSIEHQQKFDNVPVPKWLKENPYKSTDGRSPDKGKDKGKNIEPHLPGED